MMFSLAAPLASNPTIVNAPILAATLASRVASSAALIFADIEAALVLNARDAVFRMSAPSEAATDAESLIEV